MMMMMIKKKKKIENLCPRWVSAAVAQRIAAYTAASF